MQIQTEYESSEDESEQHYYMVQGNDSLEVNSETHLNDCASSSCDEYIDADALNEELSIVCSKLLEKYNFWKRRVLDLTKKIRICVQN